VRANFTPDAVWVNGGNNVLSVVGDARHAVAIYDSTSTIKGVTQTQRFCMVDEVTPEGLTSSTRLLAYDQAAGDAHMNR
jgi:hypothetical protein